MDGRYHPPPHHSRSVSHLPQLESQPPTAPGTVRPSDLFLNPNNLRRTHNDTLGIPHSQPGNLADGPYNYSGETWMDFLRQTGQESRGRDTDRHYEALRAAFAPQSGRGLSASGHIEARKRRLTAPESPHRRGSYGPTLNAGPSLGESSRSTAPGSSMSTAIDLTTPEPSPSRQPNSFPNFGGLSGNPQVTRDTDIVIPRWQPDADVQKCPVCSTQFSFWYRKHHCRYVYGYKYFTIRSNFP
jgi:hypothetical protein